jgi:hypothetical protein
MFDASKHYISVDPAILARQWDRYQAAYKKIESSLPRFGEITSPLVFKTHPLGGFLFKREPESKLKRLFEDPENKYLLHYAGKRYSRGLTYYPGLLKDLDDSAKITFILRHMREIIDAFCIDNEHPTKSVSNAIAQDYIRNYLLILYHAFRLVAYRQSLITKSEKSLEQLDTQLKSVILDTELALFRYISAEETEATLPVLELLSLITKLRSFFKTNEQVIKEELRGKKLIREVREMDSLTHIILFAKLIAKNGFGRNTILIGLDYGGIELPFAVNAIRIMDQKERSPEVILRLSHYSRASQLATPTEFLSLETERKLMANASYAWIMDDSVTTARTIQGAIRLVGGETKTFIGIVTFKVSNRYHHLTMQDHGGFNPTVAQNSVILCQANYGATYQHDSYLNRAGVFDINKHNLYKALGRELLP